MLSFLIIIQQSPENCKSTYFLADQKSIQMALGLASSYFLGHADRSSEEERRKWWSPHGSRTSLQLSRIFPTATLAGSCSASLGAACYENGQPSPISHPKAALQLCHERPCCVHFDNKEQFIEEMHDRHKLGITD